ncbi:MAG: sulfatase-like hydrolase/transferase [Planctomycetes bacterium]|nr:sulfatase-like hydrolase/transferase [Planctomycetota bacterium]
MDYYREATNCSIGGNPQYQQFLCQRGGLEAWQRSELKRGPYGPCMDGFPSEQPYEQSTEGYIAAETIDFMKRAQADGKPFMVHASLPKPHQVYCPAQEFWDMYDPDALTLPPNFRYDMEAKAPNLKRSAEDAATGEWVTFEPREIEAGFRRKLRGYLGCVSHVDVAVGPMLDALDAADLAGNTIVVYTTDHGDYALEHGIIEKAPGISADAITRVPMIWRVPGTAPGGTVVEHLAELVDIPTTLCQLAGLGELPTSDGCDLSTLLAGGTEPVRDIAVTEFAWSRAVRKGTYRLVWYPRDMFASDYPDGFGELYDIEADPWEMNNLYVQDAYQDTVRKMQADLMDWLVTTSRPVTVLQITPTDADRADPSKRIRYTCCTEADGKLNWRRIATIRGTNYV